ncbi:lysozyme inhibitor LprI family protein [Acidithiobacillus sp.]
MTRRDNNVVALYWRALQNTAPRSPEQKKIISEQEAYLRQRDACGKDALCILRLMEVRRKALYALTQRLQRELPDTQIQSFLGKAAFPASSAAGRNAHPELLAQRILEGFDQYPTPHVTLPDGSTVFWGFVTGNGGIQSVAITDPQNQVQIVGAVDDLLLAGTDPQKNQKGRLALFVRDPQALPRYLPAIRAWAAADVLGFNQNCPGMDEVHCQAALKFPLPIQAYDLNCKVTKGRGINQRCALPLPTVPDNVSPGLFWQ